MPTVTPGLAALPRSFLYVPADKPHLFAKATAGGVDAVVLDLEDAVPVTAKAEARSALQRWLQESHPEQSGPRQSGAEQWVRVSAENLAEDLGAVLTRSLDGIFVAKCDASTLGEVARVLDHLEPSRREASDRALRIVGLVETAQGVLDLVESAHHPRLTTFGIGEADLLGELRMERTTGSAAAIDHVRLQVVVACAAAGVAAPVAPTSTDFRDLEAFERSTRHLRDLGFRSRTAIHPGQVPVIHAVLTPDDRAVSAARDVMRRFEEAGGGVTTDADGRLVDAAVVRGAQETLARYRAARDRTR